MGSEDEGTCVQDPNMPEMCQRCLSSKYRDCADSIDRRRALMFYAHLVVVGAAASVRHSQPMKAGMCPTIRKLKTSQ